MKSLILAVALAALQGGTAVDKPVQNGCIIVDDMNSSPDWRTLSSGDPEGRVWGPYAYSDVVFARGYHEGLVMIWMPIAYYDDNLDD